MRFCILILFLMTRRRSVLFSGFSSLDAFVDYLFNVFENFNFSERTYVNADVLNDESGAAVRWNYKGLIVASWRDENRDLVLGLANGDSIVVKRN